MLRCVSAIRAGCHGNHNLFVQLFKKFFETNTSSDRTKDTAVVMTLEGRTFPVDIQYTRRPVANYLTASVETVLAIHRGEGPGDVLMFLTGQEEVEKTVEQLRCSLVRSTYHIFKSCFTRRDFNQGGELL